jgi:hypothetical protein
MGLLKKNAFTWTDDATDAFNRLKTTVTTPPVLRLPDFTKAFTIECNASGTGLGAVLMQEGHPIAFFSQASKYGHFLALSHPYTTAKVAQVFLAHVLKLHGMPNTIVSDRDPVFNSSFWRELFRLQGTSLAFSSTYHPQSDGQTKALNSVSRHI